MVSNLSNIIRPDEDDEEAEASTSLSDNLKKISVGSCMSSSTLVGRRPLLEG